MSTGITPPAADTWKSADFTRERGKLIVAAFSTAGEVRAYRMTDGPTPEIEIDTLLDSGASASTDNRLICLARRPTGPVDLFYHHSSAVTHHRHSTDEGATWSSPAPVIFAPVVSPSYGALRGTVLPTADTAPGSGVGLRFDGVNRGHLSSGVQYGQWPHNAGFDSGVASGIEIQFQSTRDPGDGLEETIAGRWSGAGGVADNFRIGIDTDHKLFGSVRDASGGLVTATGIAVTQNAFQTAVLSQTGTGLRLYLDGVLVGGPVAIPGGVLPGDKVTSLWIGRSAEYASGQRKSAPHPYPFAGLVDELFGPASTRAYTGSTCPVPSGTVSGSWHFDPISSFTPSGAAMRAVWLNDGRLALIVAGVLVLGRPDPADNASLLWDAPVPFGTGSWASRPQTLIDAWDNDLLMDQGGRFTGIDPHGYHRYVGPATNAPSALFPAIPFPTTGDATCDRRRGMLLSLRGGTVAPASIVWQAWRQDRSAANPNFVAFGEEWYPDATYISLGTMRTSLAFSDIGPVYRVRCGADGIFTALYRHAGDGHLRFLRCRRIQSTHLPEAIWETP